MFTLSIHHFRSLQSTKQKKYIIETFLFVYDSIPNKRLPFLFEITSHCEIQVSVKYKKIANSSGNAFS